MANEQADSRDAAVSREKNWPTFLTKIWNASIRPSSPYVIYSQVLKELST